MRSSKKLFVTPSAYITPEGNTTIAALSSSPTTSPKERCSRDYSTVISLKSINGQSPKT